MNEERRYTGRLCSATDKRIHKFQKEKYVLSQMTIGREIQFPRKMSDHQDFQPNWLNRLLFFNLIVVVNFHKVAAVDSRLIGQVDDNRKITKVGRAVRIRRKEDVGVFGLEGLLSRSIDGRVLPTEVANFARLGHGDIAGRFLATAVRVKVSTSGVAVAIFGHWSGMDVIR